MRCIRHTIPVPLQGKTWQVPTPATVEVKKELFGRKVAQAHHSFSAVSPLVNRYIAT
jgi:hypothetical protein